MLNSSSDPVYAEIRDLNFCVLKSLLRQKLAYINETYQEKDTKNTVTDIKNYIPKLKKAKNEAEKAHNHLNLAVYITNETTISSPICVLTIFVDVITVIATAITTTTISWDSFIQRVQVILYPLPMVATYSGVLM